MHTLVPRWILSLCLIGLLTVVSQARVLAEPAVLGPESCRKCHKLELEIWEASNHAKSVESVHKTDKAKAIMKAIGEKRMTKTAACTMCHFTMVETDGKTKAVAGPSCESCHGASSIWKPIHSDYGHDANGNPLKQVAENAAHRAERTEASAQAGMVWPQRTFDVASNCLSCHGLTNDSLSADTLGKMLEAGHPINSEFELVRFFMGKPRHRFYPPDTNVNAEMTPPQMARFFIAGHAASIVAATQAQGKVAHPKYRAAQQARISAAKTALEAIQDSVSEAGTLLQDPSEANARALVAAIQDKDISGAVGDLLPAKNTYK